jgi:hypothetical protein
MSEQTYASSAESSYASVSGGGGWPVFAGILILIAAALNIIDGIAAIGNSTFFVGEAKLIFNDLNTWGWVLLILGVVQLLAAFGIFVGNQAARWLGVVFASLNAIAQLLFISTNASFALAVFALDILVIYGLVAHGRERAW